jgi:hypothetical protein
VSVSYYIDPLTYEETCAYIYHRMSIASLGAWTHFEASALKRIYKFSGGIPRMINIACDKSLFTAHRLKHSHISGEIAKTAILSLSGRSGWRWIGFLNEPRAALIAGGCCLLLILMMVAFPPWQADRPRVAPEAGVKPTAAGLPEKPKVIAPPGRVPEPVENASRTAVPVLPKTAAPAVKPAAIAAPRSVSEKFSERTAKMTHSVQVGAFRSRNQAKNLVSTLKQKGYPADILTVTDTRRRPWFTVRIGDYPSRETAVQRAEEFTSREKIPSAVRPFEKL